MSVKSLGFEEIKRRSENFRKIVEKYKQPYSIDSPEAEKFLEENSLAPVVGTICDQQITAEDAWYFPYWLSKQLHGREFITQLIHDLGKRKIKNLLQTYMEDKWPSGMRKEVREKYLENTSTRIINTCRYIIEYCNNNPDNMFRKGRHTVPEIYFILRILPGIGPKKASMVARDFVKGMGPWYKGICKRLGSEVKVEGMHFSDVPVDVHVVKVFGRVMGEFKNTPRRERFLDFWPDIQNFAKLTFPDFPGKIDEILWEVGRNYCDEREPNCKECPLKDIPCSYVQSLLGNLLEPHG